MYRPDPMTSIDETSGQTAKRPWGIPKKKPLCKVCGHDLVGDQLNVIKGSVPLDELGIEWVCVSCHTKATFYQVEQIVTYWRNGGLRRKPGPKSNQSSQLDEQAS